MHGLQEIIRINAKQEREVIGRLATVNLSARLKQNRDRRVEKGLKRAQK